MSGFFTQVLKLVKK